jgi:hypothetical protein
MEEKPASEALTVGRALHALLEDEAVFTKGFITLPEGMRRDARTAKYQEFLAEAGDKEVLTRDQAEMLFAIRDKLVSHPLFHLTRNGKVEHSGFWKDKETGVICKIRPDLYLDDGVIFDWKSSAAPVNPFMFSKVLHDRGYHISAAMYLEGMQAILGATFQHFVLVAIEKFKPYECIFYEIDSAAIEKGQEDFRSALRIYAECKAKNEWPGYPRDFQVIGLPHYAYGLKG